MNDLCFSLNKLIALAFGCLLAIPAGADENDFRCLKSVGLKNPLRLQFTLVTDQDDVGNVIYEKGSARIPLKRVKETQLRRGQAGRPSEIETRWAEMTPAGTGGTYVVVSQGAVLSSFRYLRQDGKQFTFTEEPEAATEQACRWPVE